MQRRSAILGGLMGLLSPGLLVRAAWGRLPPLTESTELERRELELSGDARLANRCTALIPRNAAKGKLPALVLLHGLGETGNPPLGLRAWPDLYGAVRAHERLRRPPVAPLSPKLKYLSQERCAEVNAALKKDPFRGMVLLCPVTPNPSKHRDGLDRYAEWIAGTLLPKAKAELDVDLDRVGLDGCSLGGYVGMEVFLRKPELFKSVGGVQAAFSVPRALEYAKRLASALERVGARRLHFVSSSGDPYRKANEALSKKLQELKVEHTLRVPPGPHNQPWLREVGTLEMLLFHDRALR